MKLATWNVNSIRSRLGRLLAWLEKVAPDVVCLQELKCADEAFPHEPLRRAGYRAAVHGQKTYNGVAILTRTAAKDVTRGFGDEAGDPQARLISAEIGGVRVVCAYVPNGGEVGSEKYAYKLDWMRRLLDYLGRTAAATDRLVLCGDLNVARDDLDVARPDQWRDTVLCDADARAALDEILKWGLVDVFRSHHPEGGVYSWWDYRRLAFAKNNGLRIDHILATGPLAEVCSSAWVDRDQRKGAGDDKPSDHAPVLATFEIQARASDRR